MLKEGGASAFQTNWNTLITLLESDDDDNQNKKNVFCPLPAQFEQVCLAILSLLEDDVKVSDLGLHDFFGQSMDEMVARIKPLLVSPSVLPDVVPPTDAQTSVNRQLDLECSDDGDAKDVVPDVSVIDPIAPPSQSRQETKLPEPIKRTTYTTQRYTIYNDIIYTKFVNVPSPTV